MGNSLGANLSVQLDQKGPVAGGSKLTGRIYINVEKEIPADSIVVKFSGHEKTQCVSGGATAAITSDKHKLVSINHVLHHFDNGRANEGQYEYPFEIIIPTGLPGKLGVVRDKDKVFKRPWFVIEYFLEARLYREGISNKNTVRNSHEIFLSDPVNFWNKTPSFNEPITRPLFSCCFKTGQMTLLANVDSTNILMDDKFQIEYAIRNESSAKVQKINIKVKEIREHKTGNTVRYESSILQEQEIPEQKIQNSTGSNFVNISVSNVDFLRNAIKSETVQVSSVFPSYLGQLIQIRHVVEVKVITNHSNFQVDIPIRLVRNQEDNFKGIYVCMYVCMYRYMHPYAG
jgi:hypothetical protein